MQIKTKIDKKWLEIDNGAWKYAPFCIEKPCDHNAVIGDDDSKYHVCILHAIYGYAFHSNKEEWNDMTKEELAEDYIKMCKNINLIETTFDEMINISMVRHAYKLDMLK